VHDGLWDVYNDYHMGLTAENVASKYEVSRERQDAFAAESQAKAVAAIDAGRFKAEIVPVEIPQRKGDPVLLEADEGVRPGTTTESLGGLRPAFAKDGNVTAGNASQISDGGAAVIVCSAAKAKELGLSPLGEIVSIGQVAGPDASLISQPARAISTALGKAGLAVSDIDLFELNEAFASVVMLFMRQLGIEHDKINVNGGAIAMGHPLGATGAMILGTVLDELERRNQGTALVNLCVGGGMGTATIIERV
jgi:acetyl-CoA C-acetyltransferase